MAKVDVGAPGPFPFGAADRWRIVVTDGDRAVAYAQVADPGPTDAAGLQARALRDLGGAHVRRARLAEDLNRRMGFDAGPAAPRPSCSVVVCTRCRPARLQALLGALAALDPAPDEVIVVDSAPGQNDVRELVEASGARYLREDRHGQNRARAKGLRAATCELVAFTDDDCLPPVGWLAALGDAFDDPTVGAVTGVAFGWEMRTRAQWLREELLPFQQELVHRRWDWRGVRPVSSGRTGAGANMIFRRRLLLALGDAFPPELDGGTPTLSGGDLWALYRVMASGWRVLHDPAAWIWHDHPWADEDLYGTAERYGTGFSAFLTKALVEHRELGGFVAWSWLIEQVLVALGRSLMEPAHEELRVRSRYLIGGLRGALAWAQSSPAVPVRERPVPADPGAFADHAPLEIGPAAAASDGQIDVIATAIPHERNRRAAASSARLLLFCLAAPAPGAADHHARAHQERTRPAVVTGVVRPTAHGSRLASQLSAWRLEDAAALTRRARVVGAGDMTVASLSIPRDSFLALGGFDERLCGDAAACDLALRALDAGLDLAAAPGAQAFVEPPADLDEVLAAARRDAYEHGVLARDRPEVTACAPPRLRGAALDRPRPRRVVLGLAGALEALRARQAWHSMATSAEARARVAGWLAAQAPVDRPELVIDLDRPDPVPAPQGVAPVIRIRAGGATVLHVTPDHHRWGSHVVHEIVQRLPDAAWLTAARSWLASGDEAPDWAEGCIAPVPADDVAPEAVAFAAPRAAGFAEWADARIREAQAAVVFILLPGATAREGWHEAPAAVFAGPRVAFLSGAGRSPGELHRPLILRNRRQSQRPFVPLGRGAQYFAVRRDAYIDTGGFGPEAALAPHVGLFDLQERILDAGAIVGYLEVEGLFPYATVRPASGPAEWNSSSSRGLLLALRARQRGGLRAGAWALAQAWMPSLMSLSAALSRDRKPSLRHWSGTFGAVTYGLLRGWVARR